MARVRNEGPITLSVLDRLIDELPRNTTELPLPRAQSLRILKAGVRRDLEWLLNTRQIAIKVDDSSQLEKSLFTYGLPDIAGMSLGSVRERQRLTQAIETAVARFEPRLANVRVTLVTSGEERAPVFHFLIEGLLRIDPSPEQVSFDTLLELSSGEYKVQGDAGAR